MNEYCQNIKNLERIKNFLLDPQSNHSIKEKLEVAIDMLGDEIKKNENIILEFERENNENILWSKIYNYS